MGKYMRRKAKASGDMDASLVSGVRTRAKTLALQRLPDSCYLELRSRRLEKRLVQNSQKAPLLVVVVDEKEPAPSVCDKKEENPKEKEDEIGDDMEIEASFGDNNNLDLEPRASRSTRESTPCSLIKPADDITPPGSSTKPRPSPDANQRAQNALLRNIPTARDMEEFFAQAEESQQRLFMDKYNFDIVNDVPLPGRYEWVKVE